MTTNPAVPTVFTFPNQPRFFYENGYGDFCFGRVEDPDKRGSYIYDYLENNVVFQELGNFKRYAHLHTNTHYPLSVLLTVFTL